MILPFSVEKKLFLALLLLFSLQIITIPATANEINYSTWVWKNYQAIIEDLDAREEFFNFLSASPNQLPEMKTIYLYCGKSRDKDYLGEDSEKLKSFIKEAHEKGFQVHYLDGEISWIDNSRAFAIDRVKNVLRYNTKANLTERFDGIQLDIEPFKNFSKWRQRMTKKLFVGLYQEVKAAIKEGQSDLLLGAVISPGLKTNPTDQKIILDLLNTVDYLVITSQSDNGEKICQSAKFELQLAEALGKDIIVGVETQEPSLTYRLSNQNTFYEEGSLMLVKTLTEVADRLSPEKSFYGFGLHYYDSLRMLPKKPSLAQVIN